MGRMFSKYERRTDTRSYGDRKKLYEGGAEVIRAEALEAAWKEKLAEFQKRPAKRLPKWFGVRPGKTLETQKPLKAKRELVKKRKSLRRRKRRRKRKRRRRRRRSKFKS